MDACLDATAPLHVLVPTLSVVLQSKVFHRRSGTEFQRAHRHHSTMSEAPYCDPTSGGLYRSERTELDR